MKYAIISDIHSNLEALETVMPEIEKHKPDKLVCLGDIVGYGPNPNETIDIIRKNADIVVPGNHEQSICNIKAGITYFLRDYNEYATEALIWTMKNLTKENLEFIDKLISEGYTKEENKIIFAHSTPFLTEEMNYIHGPIHAQIHFFNDKERKFNYCFVGHTHRPKIYEEKNKKRINKSIEIKKKNKLRKRALIVAPSIGQPRDGNNKTGFMIFDSSTNILEYKRMNYDFKTTQDKMKFAGLPTYLVERLEFGR
ncbi:MAG: metallophosphoesterase family protein [Nanoarchaeota archaeon]|nr:metallophosphoesterase [Nanoarchaeota archaeon]MBU1029699.1 metallophosphoesterase [Nanoarchaeota archaeon]MBU1849609.1 metallophosphoesterase [Nanoarchaeota archaeon]